ncbi:MAG: enoyl-CoA hydratase/isomerase family protein [Thermoanaerobaculia bacterium]|nr:enoyl-CoA hydratase/isomerase family protein [Thermoanaerobaculia bacterium]
MAEILDAVRAAEADPAVRSIFITGGAGRFFAAGADIPTLQKDRENPLVAGGLLDAGLKTINAIEACSKPVVALVNGIALGAAARSAWPATSASPRTPPSSASHRWSTPTAPTPSAASASSAAVRNASFTTRSTRGSTPISPARSASG